MSIKIKKINIHGFRGIPDLELEPEGKSLLLRGENGTGKSSIVEAIEFFFTGKVSHLEGVQGLSLRRHGPHINCTPDDINVSITFDPGNISLTRTFTSSPFPPAPLEDYFKITQKGTFILRRSQTLEFIRSQPAERFRAIGSIVGIQSLDNVELEMMRLRDELEGKVASKEKEINRLISDLSNLIGKEITEIKDVLPALNETLQKANLPLIMSLEEVDKHAQEMMRAVRKAESIERIAVLNEILKITNIPLISQEIVTELDDINEKVKYLLQDRARVELSIAGLLETGRKFIEEEKMNVCPLCEQEINREILLIRIDERLRILQALSDKASEIRKISVGVIDNLKGISNKLSSAISKIELFDELSKEKEMLLDKFRILNVFIDKVTSAKDFKNEIPIQEFIQQKEETNNIRLSISTKCNGLLSTIGLSEDEKKVLEVIRLIEQARSKVKDISNVSSELKAYKKRYELAEKIYSTFSETKKAKIQEVYNTIQEDMQNFHSMLHPNEPHKNIELVVALGRRASTEMEIESFGRKGEDPRALTSEGYLDSLGLCIFLAFVKKFNEGCPLIVLDDVVTTIDAGHRENICKLLFEKFGEKQLIITTHDGIWYEQLRASQRAYGVEGNFKNLVIIGWNVDTGPIVRPYKARWERIQEKTAAGDKSGAGNEARQYLEWILETICEALQIPVPFKSSGRYEVRELLMPAKKRVYSLIKENTFKAEISKTFQNLDSTMIMGNLLSHNNILVENVSIEEVKGFCDSVRKLHNIFLYPECGHFVSYYRDLKIIRCSNPKCKKPLEVKTN
jgi:DNA repair exonuclease SbcCD ATPase subunit